MKLFQVNDLNLPLKHNQLVVAKFISQIREDDCHWCKYLLAAEKNEFRREILTLKVHTALSPNEYNIILHFQDTSDPRLINLLMLADFLATCAIGDNEVIDSICRTIYGEEELIDIISNGGIALYRKRPFMKLLVWVYMTHIPAKKRSSFYRNNE